MEIMTRNRYIVGIDEAGRGPLAGPVVVAGVKMTPWLAGSFLCGIRDSKKLSSKKREEWFVRLTSHPKVEWSVARVSPATIDLINIRQATLLGARRVFSRLSLDSRLSLENTQAVLLDGGLFLPRGIRQRTIIKGDEKIPVIAAASIIAKVTRDRLMIRLHKKYPEYRFDRHKGYGTVLHREMIEQYGRCEMHRVSFSFARYSSI